MTFDPGEFERSLGNAYTWFFSQEIDVNSYDSRLMTRTDFDLAKTNLAACDFVGVVERMADSLTLLAAELGWEPPLDLAHENRTPTRPRLRGLPTAEREVIENATRFDRAIYDLGCELFEARWRAWLDGVLRERSDARRGPPPEQVRFTFAAPYLGGGWYDRERSDRGWFSWSGPAAWLEFAVAGPGPLALVARIHHALTPAALGRLTLSANGVRLETRFGPGDGATLLTATVPAHALTARPGRVRLDVACPAARPCDLDPANADDRLLGIALAALDLTPTTPG